ncbi:MAG: hypothetical protein PVG64_02265 [Syntrophobacterales bacterium]
MGAAFPARLALAVRHRLRLRRLPGGQGEAGGVAGSRDSAVLRGEQYRP